MRFCIKFCVDHGTLVGTIDLRHPPHFTGTLELGFQGLNSGNEMKETREGLSRVFQAVASCAGRSNTASCLQNDLAYLDGVPARREVVAGLRGRRRETAIAVVALVVTYLAEAVTLTLTVVAGRRTCRR